MRDQVRRPRPPFTEGASSSSSGTVGSVDQTGARGVGRLPVVRAGEVDLELGGERLGPVERAPPPGAIGQDPVDRGAGGEVGPGRGEVDLVGHADRCRGAVDLDRRLERPGPPGEGVVPAQQRIGGSARTGG